MNQNESNHSDLQNPHSKFTLQQNPHAQINHQIQTVPASESINRLIKPQTTHEHTQINQLKMVYDQNPRIIINTQHRIWSETMVIQPEDLFNNINNNITTVKR